MRRTTETTEEPFLGADGLAMLLLACLVASLSLGLSLLVALWHVTRVARAAPVAPDPAMPLRPRRAVVLGRRLPRGGGVPCDVYRARLDRARALAARDPGLGIVLLGGATRAGLPSEAEAGRRYLAAAGLAEQRIAIEGRSRHTLENLRNYRAAWSGGDAPDLLVTSRCHLARAALMARGLGLAVLPCAAEAGFRPTLRALARLGLEAFLVHWYVVGRSFARITGHRGMLRRIG